MNPTPAVTADKGQELVLVFTDMESSSRLWESEGDKFYSTLKAHMDLLQETCRTNGGRAVKSTGDGFFMVFERPEAAVHFALESQIRLARRPELPAARIGIDIGEVFVVTEPGNYRDYVGPGANRAARICALAAARTVLVSEKIAGLLAAVPLGATLESIGNHSLRNIGLETIYLLRHEGLSDEKPKTRGAAPALPWSGDLFVGRDSTLEKVVASLRDVGTRCVSIVGLGGMGKTRLSMEAARQLTDEMADGIVVAELDGIQDIDVGWSMVAGALRTIGYEGEVKPQDIGAFLHSKRILLILDGVEGLPRTANMISDLLSRTKNLKLLVSSRNRLKIPSVFYTLESLSLPDAQRLLRARMEVQEPGIGEELSESDLQELCRRLDCIPLSLELAAARASLMTPGQMLDRIESRFVWMTDSDAAPTSHRRSLEATIAWSYDLLTPSGQTALKFASLFPIGFRLDVWERLMGPTSLDALGELQRSSLIASETRADQPGKVFYLLETIRFYAAERLRSDASIRMDAVSRFGQDMLDQARRALSLCRTPAEASVIRDLEELAPNLHTALTQLTELGSNWLAAQICEVLAAFNHYCGRNRQAKDLATSGLTLNDASLEPDDSTKAGLLRWLASASLDLGDAPTCAQSAFTLLGIAGKLPPAVRGLEEARGHNLAGLAFTASVDPKSASNEFESALSMAVAMGDRSLEGMVRHNMGWLAFCHNEYEAAAGHLEVARVLREGLGDLRGIAETSSNLGLLELERGNAPAAIALHFRSLDCWSAVLDIEGIGKALFNLAECFEKVEKLDAARAFYAAAFVTFERSESQYIGHPRSALNRLGDLDHVKETIAKLDGNATVEWLKNRYGDDSVAV